MYLSQQGNIKTTDSRQSLLNGLFNGMTKTVDRRTLFNKPVNANIFHAMLLIQIASNLMNMRVVQVGYTLH